MATHQFKTEIEIQATPVRVWDVMIDFVRWPEWTASVSKIELLDGESIAVGQRVKITQPQLPVAVWKLAVVEPGKCFEWVSGNFLVKTVAKHRIEPTVNGARVVLTIDFSGWLAGFVARKYSELTKEYMDLEAKGLKARSEQIAK